MDAIGFVRKHLGKLYILIAMLYAFHWYLILRREAEIGIPVNYISEAVFFFLLSMMFWIPMVIRRMYPEEKESLTS